MLQYNVSHYSNGLYADNTQGYDCYKPAKVNQVEFCTRCDLTFMAASYQYEDIGTSGTVFEQPNWELEKHSVLYMRSNQYPIYQLFFPNIGTSLIDFEIKHFTLYRKRDDEHKFLKIYEKDYSNISEVQKLYYRDNLIDSQHNYQYYGVFDVINYRNGGELETLTIKPCFKGMERVKYDGYYISDDTMEFRGLINLNINSNRTFKPNIVETLYTKYPYVINNSDNNYNTFNIDTSLIELNNWKIEGIDITKQTKYRELVIDFLTNNKTKLLRLYDGTSYLVQITSDSIQNSSNGYLNNVSTNFTATVIENGNNWKSLYENKLTEINQIMEGGYQCT